MNDHIWSKVSLALCRTESEFFYFEKKKKINHNPGEEEDRP